MSLLGTVGAAFAGLGSLAASATMTRETLGEYDPATGGPTPGTTTTATVWAVLDASSLRTMGFKFGEGLVQAGDIEALIPAQGLTFNPDAGDKLTVGGVSYTVIQARPTYEGAVPVVWSLLVRR